MKHINKYLIVFCVFAFWINGGQSEKNKGNCIIKHIKDGKELSDNDWKNGVDLGEILDTKEPRSNIQSYKFENIYDVESSDANVINPHKRYFVVDRSYEGDTLYINTDIDFGDYENYETEKDIVIKVVLHCNNDEYSDIIFKLSIKDTNNHDPVFLNAPYKYKLPMPIPKGLSMGYLNPILARDVDLTNSKITYYFDANETKAARFLISSVGRKPDDVKLYPTKFTAAAPLDFEEEVSVTLYAKDSGDPSRTAKTTVTIVVDKANSQPQFSHAHYVADLTTLDYKKKNNVTLQFMEKKNVTLVRGYADTPEFELMGVSKENEKHFKLSHSGAMTDNGITAHVDLINLSEEFLAQKELSVVLMANKKQIKAFTVIRIIFPEVVPEKENCIQNAIEDDSTNGYMVATILLSLIVVGLIVYIIYLYVYRR